MRTLLIGLVAAHTLLSGCALRSSSRGADLPRTVLEVDNRGFADMTVYVVNLGQRVRLGVAPGLRKTELTIPPSVVRGGQLSFLADPIGSSRTSVSDQIYVTAGETVTLIINP